MGVSNFATKLVAMATSLEESEKVDLTEKIHANTFHLVKKNRENRCSRYRDSFAHIKKKDLRKVKYIARSACLPSGLNKKKVQLQNEVDMPSGGRLIIASSI